MPLGVPRYGDASFGGTHDVHRSATRDRALRHPPCLLHRQYETENRGTASRQKGSHSTTLSERVLQLRYGRDLGKDNVLKIIVQERRDQIPTPVPKRRRQDASVAPSRCQWNSNPPVGPSR